MMYVVKKAPKEKPHTFFSSKLTHNFDLDLSTQKFGINVRKVVPSGLSGWST
jgi:hypothetical protein